MTDLSTVKGPYFLVVDRKRHDDETVATLHPSTMERLGLVEGTSIILRAGKHQTVLLCAREETAIEDRIHLDYVARRALHIVVGDPVTLDIRDEPPFADRIEIAVVAESVKGLKISDWEKYPQMYFHRRRRIVRKNLIFSAPDDPTVKFRVISTEVCAPDDSSVKSKAKPTEFLDYCIVDEETKIDEKTKVDEQTKVDKPHPTVIGSDPGDVCYSDIGGSSKEVDLIREIVELPLCNPKAFAFIGIQPPRGILMFGPPGTGKTLIARAVANESSAQFFLVNGPEIMSDTPGGAEVKIQTIFEEAAKNPPAIIFFDEIDSIAPKRDKACGDIERRVVNQLLVSMDGLTPRSNVIVMAATNRPNSIDPALRRFGRFDREVEIGIPDFDGRLRILKIHTDKMSLAEDVDLEKIASDTHGYVGSDIASVCSEAAVRHIRKAKGSQTVISDMTALKKLAVTMEDFRWALESSNPSSLRENHVEIQNVRWSDIGGLKDVIRELQATVQDPIEYPNAFLQYDISSSRGILLCGPPGTGKTLLAKAVATECHANFISIRGPELLSKWFGESEANVRDIFDKARAAAPCVMFFDELDSIAMARGSGDDAGGASDRILNQILTEMDGIGPKKKIFIIGATNRPEQIDPALLRPGRFDRLIYIPLPNRNSRLEILTAALKNPPKSEDVDPHYLSKLAKRTKGFSGADLQELCQRAKRLAFRETVDCARRTKEEKGKHVEEEANRGAASGGVRADKKVEEAGDDIEHSVQITREHLETARSLMVPSVQNSDITKAKEFARSHGAYMGNRH